MGRGERVIVRCPVCGGRLGRMLVWEVDGICFVYVCLNCGRRFVEQTVISTDGRLLSSRLVEVY